MDHSAPVAAPRAGVDSGTVRVGVRVRRPAREAWSALYERDRLAQWFGVLDRPWQVARPGRIDFGDGDFFDVTATGIREGRYLEFEWRFLGAGPAEAIRWSVTAAGGGARVEVTDTGRDRAAAEAGELAAGWTDFLERLARYLATGRPQRYAWRGDIDGSVDVPEGSVPPLAEARLHRWLPIAADGLVPRWFLIADQDGPRRFEIEDWSASPGALSFAVLIPDGGRTRCQVAVSATSGGGMRLRFEHTGWHGLGLPDGRVLALRRRFARTWAAALAQVKDPASPRIRDI